MVKFLINLYRISRWQRAFKQCEKRNQKGGKFIVINLGNKPLLINRKRFRKARFRGIFPQSFTWAKIKNMKITRETFKY